jgi:hypothetical protein
LFLRQPERLAEDLLRFHNEVVLPRYVGVVSLQSGEIGLLHLLVDITSTLQNPHFLAVIPVQRAQHTNIVAESLAREFQCKMMLLS